ncbi:MAG TPA: TlpA disulfide reductase family protein [Chitinophagaceae bacterium]|nr:TlpA disulfide reductase family protein [Chitinophagaceae bacterium]
MPLKTLVKKGKFSFKGNIRQEYEHVYLTVKRENIILGWCDFFICATEMQMEILALKEKKLDSDIKYRNVPFVEELRKYKAFTKSVEDSLAYNVNLLIKAINGYRRDLNKDSLEAIAKNLTDKKIARRIKFIKTITNSYIGLYLFNKDILNYVSAELRINPDSLMSIYSVFPESIQETYLGKSVVEYINKRQSLQINSILPDFSFITNTGQQYRLSSLLNKKYVLLCFWDAGCIPCIKNFPLLNKVAKDYEEKELQLVSVSIDNNEAQWLKALKKYNLPWLQTCDLPSYIKDTKVRSLYDVNYIPQYFLLDKEGRLIYHNTQVRDDDAYNFLQEKLRQLFQ